MNNREIYSIKVVFDDHDFLYTKIYGTVKEIMAHYSHTFVDSQERHRKVKTVTFI